MTRSGTPTTILALVGPTGVGKTERAVALCEALGGEIVGADSVQVYRGFDIGSAKPDAHALRGIPHHLIDVCEPEREMDAMRYAQLADAAIADVAGRGRLPVVAGGTGLWIRALLRGLLDLPPVDQALRAELQQRFDREGPDATHARLRVLDPRTAAAVHPNDRLRIVRALEVHAQTGQSLGALRHQHALGAPRYHALTVYIDVPAPHHRSVLHTRVTRMLDAGWVDEVHALVQRHGSGVRAMGSVGYRQLLDHVVGGKPLSQTVPQIVAATATYARRQRTWFGSDPSVDLRTTPAGLDTPQLRARIDAHLRAGRDATMTR